jgi:hypothetical protein
MKKLLEAAHKIRVIVPVVTAVFAVASAHNFVHAADFFCQSGNVTCLIAAINAANQTSAEDAISLEPGVYTLQLPDASQNGSGLPTIRTAIRILASSQQAPTVIERDPNAATPFNIFNVASAGQLVLDGLIVQRGNSGIVLGAAIFNAGTTSLQNTIVTNSAPYTTPAF